MNLRLLLNSSQNKNRQARLSKEQSQEQWKSRERKKEPSNTKKLTIVFICLFLSRFVSLVTKFRTIFSILLLAGYCRLTKLCAATIVLVAFVFLSKRWVQKCHPNITWKMTLCPSRRNAAHFCYLNGIRAFQPNSNLLMA